MIIIDYALCFALYILYFFPRWKSDRLIQRTMLYICIIVILGVTLMPIITSLPFMLDHPYTGMNLVPFVDIIYERGDFMRQVKLNVLLFIPFGFLYPLTTRRNTLSNTILHAFILSLIIELSQPLLSQGRVSDVTDLITNTTGALIGYLIYWPIYWTMHVIKNE